MTDKNLSFTEKSNTANLLHYNVWSTSVSAMSKLSCLPFPSASHAMHSAHMPVGIHSCLHRLYCPNKSEMYLCSPEHIRSICVFCTCKTMLQVSLRTTVVSRFKALQHFAEGNSHSEATTQPWKKTAGAAWDVAEARLLQMVYALLETFHSPQALPAAGSRALALPGGRIRLF